MAGADSGAGRQRRRSQHGGTLYIGKDQAFRLGGQIDAIEVVLQQTVVIVAIAHQSQTFSTGLGPNGGTDEITISGEVISIESVVRSASATPPA